MAMITIKQYNNERCSNAQCNNEQLIHSALSAVHSSKHYRGNGACTLCTKENFIQEFGTSLKVNKLIDY
ncbi:hypothetical protein Glove_23g167 [Diversispora epigaea]|uniref:Uncharacterized protein n=1 Tax=Diversispora epigaea TaxID=1348612 RepID=A0A397JIX8_9GLOM|nr:hypothetical protein Glove_23g167 [Diversispora epigaea]